MRDWTGENNPRYKHGQFRHELFGLWSNMRNRCNNPNADGYQNYGGRGIKVCPEWDNNFAAFVQDMGPRPPGTCLERIENDKGYGPHNCRWATRLEQSTNKRNNVMIEIDGVTKCRTEWCREYNISVGTVRNRVHRSGWTWAQAITIPVRRSE